MRSSRVSFTRYTSCFIIITRLSGIEARNSEVKVSLRDECDVCTGVEGLVVGNVPVSFVDDLNCCIVAC